MLHPPGFYYVKKPKRFVILSSDKSSECNLSCFFEIIKPRRMEHLQSEEPFSSDPYFSVYNSKCVTNFSQQTLGSSQLLLSNWCNRIVYSINLIRQQLVHPKGTNHVLCLENHAKNPNDQLNCYNLRCL